MAGMGRVGRWAGLVAAVLPLVLCGPAAAVGRAPAAAPCALRHRSYGPYTWQIERLLRLIADGIEARRECLLPRHRYRRRVPAGCFRVAMPAGRLVCDRLYARGRRPRR